MSDTQVHTTLLRRLMGMTLSWSQRRAEAQIKLAAQAAASPGGVCYYKLDIKVLNRWCGVLWRAKAARSHALTWLVLRRGLVGDILRLLASCDVEARTLLCSCACDQHPDCVRCR
jgi:hypothetical protein